MKRVFPDLPEERTARAFERSFAARDADRTTPEKVLGLVVRAALAAGIVRIRLVERDGKPGHGYEATLGENSHRRSMGFGGSMMAGASPIPAILERVPDAAGILPLDVRCDDLVGGRPVQVRLVHLRPFGRGEEAVLEFGPSPSQAGPDGTARG